MYKYVSRKEVRPHRELCVDLLHQMKAELRKKNNIRMDIRSIGSGAANMVTSNGCGSYDLDYNLVFHKLSEDYLKDPGKLKELIRSSLDALRPKTFSRGKDSTSSITFLERSENRKKVRFKLDVAIIWQRRKERLCLIHDKVQGQFIWDTRKDLEAVGMKVAAITKSGRRNELRDVYLRLKNQYLVRGDTDHPSFIVYAEAVNEVYQKMYS